MTATIARGRCRTCSRPGVHLTPHASWCAEHLPIGSTHAPSPHRPDPTVRDERLLPEILDAAVAVMRGFPGAEIVRTGPTYGTDGTQFPPQRSICRPGPSLDRWIPPVIPARDATVDEVPTGARSMARTAEQAGWSTRTRFARGWEPDFRAPAIVTPAGWIPQSKGLVDSVVVRAWRGPLLAEGVWRHGRFSESRLQRGLDMPIPFGFRQLIAVLRSAT